MSLKKKDWHEFPVDTYELGQKLLDEKNLYRIVGDRIADWVRDDDYEDLYTPVGGPALSPVRLSLVSVFQVIEKLPDRQAAEALVTRIDWKYALHLPLDDAGFSFTNLSHFRQRLVQHQAEYRVFDQLLGLLVELGFVRRRAAQRTDSTHLLGLLAKLNRLELAWETLRSALKAIQPVDAKWLEKNIPEVFLQRYAVRRSDYNISEQQAKDELIQAGADGFWLLAQLEHAPQAVRQLPEVAILQQVWEQQFEQDDRGNYRGPRHKLEAHGLIQSPHEPEVRYRSKRGKPWQGYMVQASETAEAKGGVSFITDIGVTDAQVDDSTALPAIQERLEKRGLVPAEQIVDRNYLSGQLIAKSQEKGIRLIGPMTDQEGPQGFKLDDFWVDIDQRVAICPDRKHSVSVSLRSEPDGSYIYHFNFGKQCQTCVAWQLCTQSLRGRTIRYNEYHPYVQVQRNEMKTDAFWKMMQLRPPIEGSISQLARQGMRRARYRGLKRVNLQAILCATAVNLKRLCRALGSKPQLSQGIA